MRTILLLILVIIACLAVLPFVAAYELSQPVDPIYYTECK